MAKLGKQLKLNVSVSVVQACPECGATAKMIDDGETYHLECPECGVQGFRYDSKTIARRDFPNHHTLPKKKAKVAV